MIVLIKKTIEKIEIKIRIQGGRHMLSYGYRLKSLRKSRGMTQQELGLAVGFSPASADVRIAQYESGSRLPKADISRKQVQRSINLFAHFSRYNPYKISWKNLSPQSY